MKDMDLSKLKEPFPAEDIEWRLQSCGSNSRGVYAICLAYVTNRAIMNRLDEVVGPENWKNEYTKGPDGGVLCGLSIRINGEFITKWDGAENTNIEATKGGLSGSMKRAAVQWGIGRYLYYLDEGFATILNEKSSEGNYGKTKEGVKFKWLPPELPAWALPGGKGKPEPIGYKKPNQTSNITQSAEPVADDSELIEQTMTLETYIADGNFNETDKRRLQGAINRKDIAEIKRAIAWCQSQKIA